MSFVIDDLPLTFTENEDYIVVNVSPILFSNGSRAGETSCGPIIFYLGDNIAEDVEEFKLYINSQNENVAFIDDTVITITIEDDDGMYVFQMTHNTLPVKKKNCYSHAYYQTTIS